MSDAALLATARDLIARVGSDDGRNLAARDGAPHAAGAGSGTRRSVASPCARTRIVLRQSAALMPAVVPAEDEDLAERVSYAWAGLSRACHQHAYELSPTSPELIAWIDVVERLVARVAAATPPAAGSTTKRGVATR